MSEMKWTPKQQQCIIARGGSVLVSAAAGSGKTAVLVERVIRRITAGTAPVDIDRLLIVTFTRAAAAEMRQRLSEALSKKMEEEPENRLYQRQQMLLPQASISTVHGFCARLLQEHAAKAGLPIGFKVAEESQTQLLAAAAMDAVLEEAYRKKDPAFLALANQLNSQKNDAHLREAVEEAYTFMQAQPFPRQWLRQQTDAYTAVMPLEKTPWMQPILQEIESVLESACLLVDKAVENDHNEGMEPHLDTIKEECKRLHALKDGFRELSYDDLQAAITTFSFARLSPIRAKDAVAAEYKDIEKSLRDGYKKKIQRAAKLFCGTEEECRRDLAVMAPLAEALGHLVESYKQQFTTLKREQKLLDYNDLEQESLRLLLDEETGKPTPLAQELSCRYDEIMVDEYQDTNAAQDALFLALSKENGNLFTVGDVKQSIYGFRQARPEIFTSRRDSYTPYNPEKPKFPAYITLENNFRSRREVTETVNFLFRQLMQKKLGKVEYRDGEELVYSDTYDTAEDPPTKWLLLDESATGESGYSADEAEARVVAEEIRKLMGHTTVHSKKGPRPIEWGDICILMRSRKAFPIYTSVMEKAGIPMAADAQSTLLTAPEVQGIISLLRVIDNPLRDVEMAAVMLSPLYGFTPDDLARLRLSDGDKKQSTALYVLTEVYSCPGQDREAELCARCAALMSDLRRYRTLAVSLPADRLLETIYRDTGAEGVYAARPGGRQKVANLRQLDRVVRGFEQGGFRGLSAFVRYVDKLEENGKDLAAGSTQGQTGVHLMTVHGSKGLEFPVVFLPRLEGKGANTDARKKLLFHATAGIGMRMVDEEELEKHPTLPFVGVQSARRIDEGAENLRVWYVALTRAREQLYLVATVPHLSKKMTEKIWEMPMDDRLLTDTLLHAANPGDVLLTAAVRHPDFIPFRGGEQVESLPAQCHWQVEVCAPPAAQEETAAMAEIGLPDDSLTSLYRERLAYVYPYAPLQSVPAKLAASQLSHESMNREFIAMSRPAFLQKEKMNAAQKGTAMHTFMQFGDYARAAANLEQEIHRLEQAGFLTSMQAQSLDRERLEHFFTGELYARMQVSPRVWREYDFKVPVKAGALTSLPSEMAEETVLVQGIADCVFQEGDALVLVDYKTDRVKEPTELADRYRSQMQFYKEALEPLLGLPVKETVLYSFSLGCCVPVSL